MGLCVYSSVDQGVYILILTNTDETFNVEFSLWPH